jgi:hypothetical protein
MAGFRFSAGRPGADGCFYAANVSRLIVIVISEKCNKKQFSFSANFIF